MTVYEFDELSEDAKKRALEQARDIHVDHDWWEYTYEDAVRMGAILGIEIGTRKQNSGKHSFEDIDIYFQCNSTQGDRATYAGTYDYKPDAVEKIKAETNDPELLRLAQELQIAQVTGALKYGTQFRATINHASGHAMNMSIVVHDVNDDGSDMYDYEDVAKAIEESLRDFADWIHKQLVDEQDYLMSDEAVAETIRANEYEFDEEGTRV